MILEWLDRAHLFEIESIKTDKMEKRQFEKMMTPMMKMKRGTRAAD